MTDRKLNKSLTTCTIFCSARTSALTETHCPGASVHLRAGACQRSATRCVCERSRQDQNWAGRALLSALLKRRCLLTANAADAQATTKPAAASTKGDRRSIEGGNFDDVLISARCRMGFDRYAMQHNGQPSPLYLTNAACWLPAPSPGQGGRSNGLSGGARIATLM